MKKTFSLLTFLILTLILSSNILAQPYYYNSGNPGLFASWGNLSGGAGTHPSSWGEATEYIIEGGKTASTSSPLVFNNNATLRVLSGGTLEDNSGIYLQSTVFFRLNAGATYIYNNNVHADESIFAGKEAFDPNSNIIIKNWSSLSFPLWTGINNTVNGFYFGNLELNCANSPAGDWNQNITTDSILWCAGDFKITQLGSSVFTMNYSLSVRMIVLGNYIQNAGEFKLSVDPSGVNSLQICKNFYKTGGKFYALPTCMGSLGFIGERAGNSEYQTIYCNDTLTNISFFKSALYDSKIRLISDVHTTIYNTAAYYAWQFFGKTTNFDFGVYKFQTNGNLFFNSTVKFEIGSPYGIDSNLKCNAAAPFGYSEYIYNGTVPQVTGNNLGYYNSDGRIGKITLNNTSGVTLSRNLIVKDTIEFKAGVLNLSDYNLRFDAFYDGNDNHGYQGVSATCYINTNGNGVLKQFGNNVFPIGNGSFTPGYIALYNNSDTVAMKVLNSFPYADVNDTSRMIKKCWYVDAPHIHYDAVMLFQWTKGSSDEGSRLNRDSLYYGINRYFSYEPLIYHGPPVGFTPYYGIPNGAMVEQSFSQLDNTGDLHGRYFVVGNENGVITQYDYVGGEASDPNNWIKPTAIGGSENPPDLSRTAIYNVGQNKTAVFNSPITMANQFVRLRVSGNGIIQANAPITCFGRFQLRDSSTYNHNNTGQLRTTLFAGTESIEENSNFNILMWSDTTDKITDGLVNERYIGHRYFGNLTVDFSNLPGPLGLGTWGPQIPHFGIDTVTFLTMNDFYLKKCSGYMFGLAAGRYDNPNIYIGKNLIIGDSLTPFNPVINLSYQTLKSVDSAATSLLIYGDLIIQRGGITSEQPYNKARGRIVFESSVISNNPHYFYQSPEFFYTMNNLGCPNFPNMVQKYSTLTLKSNFYNSTNVAFNLSDVLGVKGTLDCGDYIIKSSSVKVYDGGKVLVKNASGINWIFSPIQSFITLPGSQIEYCGTVPQLSGSSLPDNVSNIKIENPAGLTINKPFTITDSLTLTSGKIHTDSVNYITVLSTANIVNEDTSVGIVGSVAVKFSSPGVYYVPVSNGGKVKVIGIFTQAGDETTFKIDCNKNNPYGQNCLAPLMNVHNDIWYRITRTSPDVPMNAKLMFAWFGGIGVSNISNVRIARWNGSQWTDCGSSGTSGDAENGIIYSNYISSFSPFTIGSIDDQPLPVELSSFTSQVNGNKLNLSWVTNTEQNNSGFEIQRKKIGEDSTAYSKIGFLNGHGNSNDVHNYTYEDRNLLSGKYKYRLKQIDFNGNYKYYELANEVIIGVPVKYNMSQNYPNPFNPTTKINYDLPFDSKVSIRIFDMTGREVANIVNGVQTAGYYSIQFNGSSLSSGTYFYNIIAEGGNNKFVITKKMVLVK